MVFADSVNIARRLSSRNENDFLQETMMGKFQCLALYVSIDMSIVIYFPSQSYYTNLACILLFPLNKEVAAHSFVTYYI